MFLSNLKPVPRFLLIGAVVAGAVYGASLITDRLPKKTVEPVTPVEIAQPTTPPPNSATPPVSPAGQPPAPTEQPSGLTAAGSSDAGIANVLKAGQK